MNYFKLSKGEVTNTTRGETSEFSANSTTAAPAHERDKRAAHAMAFTITISAGNLVLRKKIH